MNEAAAAVMELTRGGGSIDGASRTSASGAERICYFSAPMR